MNNTVLITGGLGYIGSHIYLSLLKKNYYPIIIDDLSTSDLTIIKKLSIISGQEVDFYEGDVRNEKLINEILKSKKVNTIIHLAGKKSVEESIINPKVYMDINFGGTQSVLNAITGTECKKIIFSSSALVYGNTDENRINERYPLSSNSPYAESKILCEKAILSKSQQNRELSVGILRYFNPAGADKSGLIGDNPISNYRNLFVILDDIALGLKNNIEIFGDDYLTHDGTCIRDYIHISDLANGHVNLINSLNDKKADQIFNLGSGKGYSVYEVISEYEKANKVIIKKHITHKRKGDVAILRADISKAVKNLGWKNEFKIADMCISSLNFRRLNK